MNIDIRECPITLSPSEVGQIGALLFQLSPEKVIASRNALYWTLERNTVFLARDTAAATDVLDCHNGKIIGMVMIAITPDFDGLVAHIDNVCVDTEYRGNGIARLLMQEALSLVRERKVKHIDLTARWSRLEARALYESMGFRPRDTTPYRLSMGSAP